MKYELTNEQRELLGIEPIANHWDRVELNADVTLIYDGNVIKKEIVLEDDYYMEWVHNDETENRKLLLPKTAKGKPKKITATSVSSKRKLTYVVIMEDKIEIGNYTTKRILYSSQNERIKFDNFTEATVYFSNLITKIPKSDVDTFNINKKKKQPFPKEGDFFVFKMGIENYAIGRVLLDINKYRSSDEFAQQNNDGLAKLLGENFVIKIYHIMQSSKKFNLDEVKKLKALPSQYIASEKFRDVDFEIIGNIELENDELDYPISYSANFAYEDERYVYLQHGKFFAKKPLIKFNKYLSANNPYANNEKLENPYSSNGVGWVLMISKDILQKAIQTNSNEPYWNHDAAYTFFDLRNPKNKVILEDILKNITTTKH